MAELHFIGGPMVGKRVTLVHQRIVFGQAAHSDVRITGVDPTHFYVIRETADYFVVDNGSAGGTFLDGARITRSKLVDGNKIQAGPHIIEFCHGITANLTPLIADGSTSDRAVLAEIHFIDSSFAGKRVTIERSRTSFGRSTKSDVQLPDERKSVGRIHFFIDREGDRFYLTDNESTNGTWLNGNKIAREELNNRDSIRVGPYLLQFSLQVSEPAPTPPHEHAPTRTIPITPSSPHIFAIRSQIDGVPSAQYATNRLTIGRGLDCNLVLHDTYVARLHSVVERTPTGYLLIDNHTTEGTTLNDKRVVTYPLKVGDVIGIGGFELTAEYIRGGLAFILTQRAERTKTIAVKDKTIVIRTAGVTAAVDTGAGSPRTQGMAVPLESGEALDLKPSETKDSIAEAYQRILPQDRLTRPPRWVPTSDHEEPWKLKTSMYSALGAVLVLFAIVAVARTRTFVPESLSSSHLQGQPKPPITFKASDGTCSGCHSPVYGIDLGRCSSCHDARVSAKHSNARLNCMDCHTEHKGADFRPSEVGRLACAKCHNGQYTFRDFVDGSAKILPVPHGGRPMGYPVQKGQWEAVAFKDGTTLTRESFHLRHTAKSVACLDCHSTVQEGKVDRETPELACSACHGGRDLVDSTRILIRCTSCHAQHGDFKEVRAVAKEFSKDAYKKPWDQWAGPKEGPGPILPATRLPRRYSKLSFGILIPTLLALAAVPVLLIGAIYATMRAKRRAYDVSLTAPLETPAAPPKDLDWGLDRRDTRKEFDDRTVILPVPAPDPQIKHAYPIIDVNLCVGCKACVEVCPFGVLELINGKAVPTLIGACQEDSACVRVCPTYAVKLIGTGKVLQTAEIPDVGESYETNKKGLYCIGDVTSLPLIKNAINMGKKVIDRVVDSKPSGTGEYDVAIVGVGPAGLSAALSAQAAGLNYIALEQGETANTIRNYPRQKLVLGEPVNVPAFGRLEIKDCLKEDLLELWDRIIVESDVKIRTSQKVENVQGEDGNFVLTTPDNQYTAKKVILAIGKRGTPRRLDVPGEQLPKVSYSLVDAAAYQNKHILIVGGGDSALEACIGLAAQGTNTVSLSYRKEKFAGAKSRNIAKIKEEFKNGRVTFIPNSNVKEIRESDVILKTKEAEQVLLNDYVIILIGGELPKPFLEKAGIRLIRRNLTEATPPAS